jgi:co-chaperonin GroES (HSP10)
MSQFGVHDFAIPHDYAQPVRDMIVIRIPLPPKMVGSIHMPDVARDLAQHNVMAGRVVKMGPMAFTYKDGNGLSRHDVKEGDWVIIRPFAGTLIQGGKLETLGGYRYVSSFNDVIAVVPADKMPDPDQLLWSDASDRPASQMAQPMNVNVSTSFAFDNKKQV